jgi:hypothetical protein
MFAKAATQRSQSAPPPKGKASFGMPADSGAVAPLIQRLFAVDEVTAALPEPLHLTNLRTGAPLILAVVNGALEVRTDEVDTMADLTHALSSELTMQAVGPTERRWRKILVWPRFWRYCWPSYSLKTLAYHPHARIRSLLRPSPLDRGRPRPANQCNNALKAPRPLRYARRPASARIGRPWRTFYSRSGYSSTMGVLRLRPTGVTPC